MSSHDSPKHCRQKILRLSPRNTAGERPLRGHEDGRLPGVGPSHLEREREGIDDMCLDIVSRSKPISNITSDDLDKSLSNVNLKRDIPVLASIQYMS